ncbi:hypothetical protein [Phaeovulum sp.]|uniref:hypothetical protein n=1 Tax=Phaeovulum sp. TaxID=2934796 RepID=UPI002730E470|nr:hypothetical protein [Phaeovulum sp.]MDP1669047.1 hypothetical protein [Phaeovulum sp.]MDZ4118016.1 hypothetical protein [Phaeovulum sp.]
MERPDRALAAHAQRVRKLADLQLFDGSAMAQADLATSTDSGTLASDGFLTSLPDQAVLPTQRDQLRIDLAGYKIEVFGIGAIIVVVVALLAAVLVN